MNNPRLDELTKSLVDVYADQMSLPEREKLTEALQVLADDQKYNRLAYFFPEEGLFRRALYPKHVDFFTAGATFRERAFIAANRSGKSEAGAYEVTCHATGIYPEWWKGRKIKRPSLIWVGGDTATTVRDIIQKKLVGEDIDAMGSGMLPKESIIIDKCKKRRNVADALEIIAVRHISGGETRIVLKTYEQGRSTWQGTEVDFIWVDEECPQDVYSEALIRLMTTGGSIITTFTPLKGVTELVLSFLDNDQNSDAVDPVYVTTCSWDDVPHLTAEDKRYMLSRTPPQLRRARSEGIPTVGEGLVYPVDPETYIVPDMPIPVHWKKLYGMDVGWKKTAAVWGAWDMDNDVIYVYSNHSQGMAEPTIHAKAIKARGEWINGEIDPAARGRSQIDGAKLLDMYLAEGLNVYPANNAVEAGIFEIWERLTTGRLKIMQSCAPILREMTLYHRDDNGCIVKKNDHSLDALRYMMNADPDAWSYQPKMRPRNKVVSMRSAMNGCT